MAFFGQAISTLSTLVIALGAGLGVWGVVNLLEGYGQDTLPLRWLPPATLLWTCHLGTSCVASCSQPTSFIKYAIFLIGSEV